MNHRITPLALATALTCFSLAAQAQTAVTAPAPQPAEADALPAVTVRATSADASAQGLSPAFPGGQVARGGRAGILGTKPNLDTPFSITSYTNELIQDRHARSVGDVLQNDASVRMARGYGNFQESYFIRGFLLSSDDVAYNGLYSLLPRQYIATELFERVEVLRGASAFLSGANPGGGGIGGAVNLLPKRAPNEDLNRLTLGVTSGSSVNVAADVARRFGPDGSTGVRINAATRNGGTSIDDEKIGLSLLAVGVDWHSRDVRLSADLGSQDNRLKQTRPSVLQPFGVTWSTIPKPVDGSSNFAQPWTYSNEQDLFGTLRGEWDISGDITAWAAYGMRRSKEANSLATPELLDAVTGAATTYRFDNTRKDNVNTGEIGLRGKLRTGGIKHEWVVSASRFSLKTKAAFATGPTLNTNIYAPTDSALTGFNVFGNDLDSPAQTALTRMSSFAIGDTLSVLDDAVQLTLGVRRQKLDSETYDYANYAYSTASDYVNRRTSPMGALVFKVNKQLSVYTNYVEGLTKGATFKSSNNTPISLRPYVSRQKEVGVKLEQGRLGLNAALFSTTKPRPVQNLTTPVGEDRHQGLEVNAYGEATRGLRVLGGLTLLDTEQQKTGVAATENKRVIGVPRIQANLGAEWSVPGVSGLALDGRLVHTGSNYANDANTLKVPTWNRIDIGARYLADVQGKLVTLRARVENVANRDYWASAGGYSGSGYLVAATPRTVSVSATIDF